MTDLHHRLWQVIPHRLRRAAFDAGTNWLAPRLPAAVRPIGPPFIVAGAFGAPTGLGEAARLTIRGLLAAGEVVRMIDLTDDFRQSRVVPFAPVPVDEGTGQGTLIVVTNPPMSSFALWRIGARRLAGRRRIASWVWEYPDVPAAWARHARRFDEIRAPTRFAAEVIAAGIGSPVGLWAYPVGLDAQGPARAGRSLAPGRPVTLGFVADSVAAFARKNAAGVVACAAALTAGGQPVTLRLVLRGGNLPDPFRAQLNEAEAAGVRVDLTVEELDVDALERWWDGIDIYVSLHHAEGFGLTVAEAMARAIPTVATGEGATADFCDDDTGWPVASEPGVSAEVFDLGRRSVWRLPDIDHAASQVKAILASPSLAAEKAGRARDRLRERFGTECFIRALSEPEWIGERAS